MQRALSRLLADARYVAARCCHAAPTVANDLTEVRYPDGRLRHLSRAWLRFNCGCPACYNRATNQRSVVPSVAAASARAPARLRYPSDGRVQVEWADGHVSDFALDHLDALLAPNPTDARTLWAGGSDGGGLSGTGPVPLDEFTGAAGYRRVLRSLWTHGVATLTGVRPTESATEAAVRRMAPVMETLFGGMWTFTSDGSRQDTAYGSDAIGLHNDTTYLHSCAGLQVFHVLEAATSGGDTCLADGFLAAETLRRESPRHFQLLAGRPVFHHYLETGGPAAVGSRLVHHTRCLDTVLKLDPETAGGLYQVRYNPYDVADLATIPQAEAAEYLEAYAHMGAILDRPESQVWLNLRPGTLLFLDNWRVLHARSGFCGRRVVTGCYVSRDAWMSEARVNGVAEK